jgi:tetratricopeptide (TPR) repeat protein
LERETKRVLQEASVIGRAFLYQILDKMTELKEHIDRCLTGLERLDLIRTRSLQPDLEYMFKHPLTQEVVYNGLLKKERQVIHEKIALVMEQLFHDRLSEFYETLAFHFKRGRSVLKAVDYLMKSGEKSVKRYSVEESHQCYKEAFDILTNKPDKSREEEGLLIDLLIDWANVFYYLGDFNGLIDLFSAHEDLAESLDDKAKIGMFNAWLGFALFMNGKGQVAYPYLEKALRLGEESENQQVIGYACTWLAWSSWDMGLLDEVITFGERANEIAMSIRSNHYLYFKPLGAIGITCLTTGDRKRCIAGGTAILDYGQKHSNIRSMAMGHVSIAFSHLIAGDLPSAIESFQRAIQVAADPIYIQYPRCFLGITYLLNGQIQEAQEALEDHLAFNQEFGFHSTGIFAYASLGVVYVVKGELSRGLEMIEEAIRESIEKGRKPATCMFEHTLGNVYLQLIDTDVPFAGEKAEEHLNRAVELAKEIGAKGDLSQAYLNLGLLHKAKGDIDQAKKCISNAIQLFEECDAEVYMKQAKEALASLG